MGLLLQAADCMACVNCHWALLSWGSKTWMCLQIFLGDFWFLKMVPGSYHSRCVCWAVGGGVDVDTIVKKTTKTKARMRLIVAGRLVNLIWEDIFFKCVGIFDILCYVWFGGDSEPSNFPVGLRSMPSIPSNLISLDTNMALLGLRLVAYHLSEANLHPWAPWSTDLISWFVQSLSGCTYLQGLHIVKKKKKIARLKAFLLIRI